MAGTWCRWEKARFPDAEFAVVGGVRVHRGVDPPHTASGRLLDPDGLDPTGVTEEHRLGGLPDQLPDDR